MLGNEKEGRKEDSEYRKKKCSSLREIYLETGFGFKAFVAQTTDLYALGEIFINKMLPLIFF